MNSSIKCNFNSYTRKFDPVYCWGNVSVDNIVTHLQEIMDKANADFKVFVRYGYPYTSNNNTKDAVENHNLFISERTKPIVDTYLYHVQNATDKNCFRIEVYFLGSVLGYCEENTLGSDAHYYKNQINKNIVFEQTVDVYYSINPTEHDYPGLDTSSYLYFVTNQLPQMYDEITALQRSVKGGYYYYDDNHFAGESNEQTGHNRQFAWDEFGNYVGPTPPPGYSLHDHQQNDY